MSEPFEPDQQRESASTAPQLRRPFLVQAGEGWLLTTDLFDYVDRFAEFMERSGLGDTQFIVSPVVAVPLPNPDATHEGGARTWSEVDPGMMWHPFFWLPESVMSRALISGDQGEYLETDEELLVRVMAQCTLAGLFDVETGTWLDVLAYAGLDSTSEQTLDRVAAWQAGESDEVLDSIDLTPLLTEAEAHTESTSIVEASVSVPNNVRGQWALTADYIGRSVRDMQAADPAPEPGEFAEVLGTFLVLAYSGFAGGQLIGDSQTREAVQQLILDTQVENANAQSIAQQLLAICARAYMANKSTLDQLGVEADDLEAAHRQAAAL